MATYTKGEAQEWAWETLKGQWTTLVTPFTPEDKIDEAVERIQEKIKIIQNKVSRFFFRRPQKDS